MESLIGGGTERAWWVTGGNVERTSAAIDSGVGGRLSRRTGSGSFWGTNERLQFETGLEARGGLEVEVLLLDTDNGRSCKMLAMMNVPTK